MHLPAAKETSFSIRAEGKLLERSLSAPLLFAWQSLNAHQRVSCEEFFAQEFGVSKMAGRKCNDSALSTKIHPDLREAITKTFSLHISEEKTASPRREKCPRRACCET